MKQIRQLSKKGILPMLAIAIHNGCVPSELPDPAWQLRDALYHCCLRHRRPVRLQRPDHDGPRRLLCHRRLRHGYHPQLSESAADALHPLASGRLCQPGYLCTQAVGHVCDDAALWWLGFAPIIIREIFESIKRINAEGTTILFVEQNARIALATAQRGYVLQAGKIELTDTCENLISNEEVQRIYLGTN